MKYSVVVTHAIPLQGLEALRETCQIHYPPQGSVCFTQEQLLERIPDADAVLAGGPIDAELIERAKRLRIISNYGAGYDRVDVACATRYGIPVTNIPDATAGVTAELAMGLIFAVRRRIVELDRRVRALPPEDSFGMGKFMGHSLENATLGILGMGHIGQRLRVMAQAMGMRVLYHNRHALASEQEGGARFCSFEELLAQSDVLSLHCPLTDESRSRMNDAAFAQMKTGAMLINTARGGVVDTHALVRALKDGRLAGAGLDVYPDEPHIPEELRAMEQVVLTPHIGSNTIEARIRMASDCAVRILEALSGRRPPNVVNPAVYGE